MKFTQFSCSLLYICAGGTVMTQEYSRIIKNKEGKGGNGTLKRKQLSIYYFF
uniref:Uncharacterized protein n=1 Tax=Anguilla anguilla TaxID=7936 RepID=A0A0E9WUE0_ANGAN